MKNVLQQVGGQAEFDKMNVLQKQALADSMKDQTDKIQEESKNDNN